MVKHIFKRLALLPLLALVILLAAAPAQAADLRKGETVIIASGDIINDDLYIAANRIVINGTVNGDVISIGGTININGKIDGSIIAIGSTIRIDGEVTRAVRIAGDDVNVSGSVGGDLVAAGNDIDITSATMVGHDLVFAGRTIRVDTPIGDSIKGIGTRLALNDGVGGDVKIGVERLTIASTADIRGNLTYISENEAIIQSGARIGGTTTHTIPEKAQYKFPDIGIWGKVIGFLMTLITGIVIILIAPKRAAAVALSIKRKTLLSLGWGAIILFATPIAILVTFITVIGIPVGMISIVIYGLAIFLSQIAVGLFLGYWIIGSFSRVDSRSLLVGAFALGFSILTLIKLIQYIGFPLWLATVLFGIGAMALSQKTLRDEASAEVLQMRQAS